MLLQVLNEIVTGAEDYSTVTHSHWTWHAADRSLQVSPAEMTRRRDGIYVYALLRSHR